MTLKAIALSIKPGGALDVFDVGGAIFDFGGAVVTVEVANTIGS